MTQCDAGRRARFGGRWTVPCLRLSTHDLAFSTESFGPRAPDTPILHFCSEHMTELIAAGEIAEVDVDPADWLGRMR